MEVQASLLRKNSSTPNLSLVADTASTPSRSHVAV